MALGGMKKVPITLAAVHPINASEPVWLVQAQISSPFGEIDWGSITQSDPEKDESFWQVAYDEQLLLISGSGDQTVIFFFHYLDVGRPLESSYGPLSLPEPTPLPAHLRFVRYEAP